MIVAADKVLPFGRQQHQDRSGAWPLGNKTDLNQVSGHAGCGARLACKKLKTAGKSADEIAASKPVCGPGRHLGQGVFHGDVFVRMVYSALESQGAFVLSGETAVAYFKFHAPQGFWPLLNDGKARCGPTSMGNQQIVHQPDRQIILIE